MEVPSFINWQEFSLLSLSPVPLLHGSLICDGVQWLSMITPTTTARKFLSEWVQFRRKSVPKVKVFSTISNLKCQVNPLDYGDKIFASQCSVMRVLPCWDLWFVEQRLWEKSGPIVLGCPDGTSLAGSSRFCHVGNSISKWILRRCGKKSLIKNQDVSWKEIIHVKFKKVKKK